MELKWATSLPDFFLLTLSYYVFFLQALSLKGKNLLSATAIFSAKSFHHLAKTFENIKVIYNNILQQNAALVI